MAAKRGRSISNSGYGLFAGPSGGAAAVVGQPVMVRMQGIPTMPGYRDRPGKWNIALDVVKRLFDKVRRNEWQPSAAEQ